MVCTAAVSAMILCGGCTPVNEDIETESSGEAAVYISPSAPSVIAEENSSDEAEYVRNTLTEEEKITYDDLTEAVNSYQSEFPFPDGFDGAEMKKLFTLVYTQENRIFWLDSKFYCDEESRKLSLFYRYDKDEAESMRAVLDLKAGEILADVPEGASDYDKILLFHDEIILGCDFSKDGSYTNTAYGAIVDGKAQCEGYAFALAYLCSEAGIPNHVVRGSSSEGATHAWNKVFADGNWYNVDCTWDDPILKYDNPNYVRHDYFMVSDEEINGKTHFPDTSCFTPASCTDKTSNYFLKNGLYAVSADNAEKILEETMKNAALSGKTEAEVRLESSEEYDKANERLFDEGGLKEIIENLNANYGLKIGSAHKNVNDSMYIIHISLVY